MTEAGPPGAYPLLMNGCAAWLHAPTGARRSDLGVVLCPALGRDERCTHRPLRILAERLARAGHLVIRFDLPGFGDSADTDTAADALPSWIAAAQAASDLLRRHGVKQVTLGGFRFGATLAALSAREGERLLLIAPVASGRSWITRQRFAAGQRAQAQDEACQAGLDADGVLLSKATCDSLSMVDLQTGAARLPPTILSVSGRGGDKLAEALAVRCETFQQIDFPGYAETFLDSAENVAPLALFDEVSALLAAQSTLVDAGPVQAPPTPVLDSEGWSDHWIRLDLRGESVAFANLTVPTVFPAAPKPAVIFLNTGGDSRAGIGRFAARACRDLAQAGHACLRLDFAGIGDSPEPPGVERAHLYETPRKSEIDAAIRLLQARGHEDIRILGVSAGGYHALQAVLDDPRVRGAFCVNTVEFVWRVGDKMRIGSNRWGRSTRFYAKEAVRASSWGRLLRGEIQVGAVIKALATNLSALRLPESFSRESRDLSRRVAAASARGARVHVLLGVEDGAMDELFSHFGSGGRRFARLPGMTLTMNDELDHGLVYRRSRDIAFSDLKRWLA